MPDEPAPLSMHYLGGVPGHNRREIVQVAVGDERVEVRGRGWGWGIGFDTIVGVGDVQPAPDGAGGMVPIAWTPPGEGPRTLMLSGTDARKLRFALAQRVASARLAADLPRDEPVRGRDTSRRAPPGVALTAWGRELRRMRSLTVAALAAALVALVLVVGVAFVLVGGETPQAHWTDDRAVFVGLESDARTARQRGDDAALGVALQSLADECRRVETYNGDAGNTGSAFTQVQGSCATVGVTLR